MDIFGNRDSGYGSTPAAGVLRVSESFDPGWRATVDGRPTPVQIADLGQQAVFVPAGAHEVALRYEPRPWRVGLALSLGGGVAIAVLGFRIRRRGAPA